MPRVGGIAENVLLCESWWMAKDIWFTSDQHWRHANILKFTNRDGTLIRPGFRDLAHMDEHMMDMWNQTVKPTGDKVYQCGDFCFNAADGEKIIKRLHGHKRWIPGNHDKIKELAKFFEKVNIWRIFKEEGFIVTHVPIIEGCFRHKVVLNVHGHTHQNIIPGPYKNICVEHTAFRPVHIDELTAIATKMRNAA